MPAKKPIRKRAAPATVINSADVFEELLKNANVVQHYQLRLYVTGTTTRSSQAITNIRALCDEFLAGHYDLEVIDIYQQPTEAAKEQIIAAPTLIKEFPIPAKRLVGNLSDREKVKIVLNLTDKMTAEKFSKAQD